jgi:hypothetical protein
MLHITDMEGWQTGSASSASRGPAPHERPNAAVRSASPPVEKPSETEVNSDSDKCLPLLTEWTGRLAVSPAHHDCVFTLRMSVRPPDQRVNPPNQLLDEILVPCQQHFPRLELPPPPALSLPKMSPRICRIPPVPSGLQPRLDHVEAGNRHCTSSYNACLLKG